MAEQRSGKAANQSEESTASSTTPLSYLLGNLDEQQEQVFEAQLAAGSKDASELKDYMDTLTSVAERVASEMPAPRAALKNRITEAIQVEEIRRKAASSIPTAKKGEPLIVRGGDSGWQDSGIEGIRMKILMQDPTNARFTVLAHLQPGARYPSHRHVGAEECYVVSGDLHVNDIVLHGGDFILTEDSTVHHETWSESGCVLLLNTMLVDEVLA